MQHYGNIFLHPAHINNCNAKGKFKPVYNLFTCLSVAYIPCYNGITNRKAEPIKTLYMLFQSLHLTFKSLFSQLTFIHGIHYKTVSTAKIQVWRLVWLMTLLVFALE